MYSGALWVFWLLWSVWLELLFAGFEVCGVGWIRMGDLEWRPRRDGHSDYRQRPFRQPLGGKGGRKRGREEPEESPEQIFVREVMDLGDEVSRSVWFGAEYQGELLEVVFVPWCWMDRKIGLHSFVVLGMKCCKGLETSIIFIQCHTECCFRDNH